MFDISDNGLMCVVIICVAVVIIVWLLVGGGFHFAIGENSHTVEALDVDADQVAEDVVEEMKRLGVEDPQDRWRAVISKHVRRHAEGAQE